MARCALRSRVVGAWMLAAAVLTGACSTGTASDEGVGTAVTALPPPSTDPESRAPATRALDWQSCGRGLECATVAVPLDPAAPDARQIDLAVARRPAGDPARRIGSLLVNPGGPGGSGLGWLAGARLPDAVHDRFDIVSWDPRGVGDSVALSCGTERPGFVGLDPHPDTPAEQAELDAAGAALATACAADADLLGFLDTTVAAADLEAIRVALGEEQISYLGFSYGTLIGQEYAAAHPDRLRALVLDGVVDPAKDLEQWLGGQAVAMEEHLGDLTERYDRVAARLEVEPLPGPDGPVGPDILVLAAVAASYTEDGHASLRRALVNAEQGDGGPLQRLADLYIGASDAYATYVAVLCTDGPHPEGAAAWQAMADRLATAAPRMGAPVANELVPCATWPQAPTRTPRVITPDRLVPALVVGNVGDAATPLVDARTVAERLPGAVLLTYQGGGHTATTRVACVGDLVATYLVDLVLPPAGSVCPAGGS